jgi:hypothetical protein
MSGDQTDNCVTLGTNKATYCGVNKTWEPREWMTEAESAFLRTVIGPTICTALIYGGITIFMFRKVRKNYKIFASHIDSIPAETDIWGFGQKVLACCTNKLTALKISFVIYWFILPVAYMVYDCADVLFDFHYFYKLELVTGNLLDNRIMRNERVNNAILAFAILGFCKIIFICIFNGAICDETQKLFYKLSSLPRENSKIIAECKEEIATRCKLAISLTALIFEDGVELFLEYFYADKYATKSDWLVLLNSTLMAIIATLAVAFGLKEFLSRLWLVIFKRNDDPSEYNGIFLFIAFPLQLIAISKVLRAISCWQQAYSGMIQEDCLKVEYGALIQTPFTLGCLSKIDYGIFALTSLSGIGILCQIVTIIIAFKCG